MKKSIIIVLILVIAGFGVLCSTADAKTKPSKTKYKVGITSKISTTVKTTVFKKKVPPCPYCKTYKNKNCPYFIWNENRHMHPHEIQDFLISEMRYTQTQIKHMSQKRKNKLTPYYKL